MRATTISLLFFIYKVLTVQAQSQDQEAVWSTITPSANLSWTTCYDTFECARFQVPLDWAHPSNSTVAVAIVRLPSTLSPSDKRYRGPIIHNPGAGASGIDAVLGLASDLQKVIGEEYDIMGFDPRGFGRTTPSLRAFLDTEEFVTFSLKVADDPPLGSVPGALARTYARFQSLGQIAEKRVANIAPYVSTPQVARDLLAITKAAGFPKLKYWGVSYGTIIGMTFATMFPDSVERLILDGVVDPVDYYSAQWRISSAVDKTLEFFADSCVKAGPDACNLHASSSSAVLSRIQAIFDHLKLEPIPAVTGNGSSDYGLIDYGMVRNTVLDFLYQPFAIPGQDMFRILASLEKGDGTLFWQSHVDSRFFLQCTNDTSVHQDTDGYGFLGATAVSCSDAAPINDTLAMLNDWFAGNANQSSFADVFPYRIFCAGWHTPAAEQFKGTIGADTSFPIMFIGNTLDPVTPLAHAETVSQLFPGSTVLTIDTPGHTSLATTSGCSFLAIQAYIRNGTLPHSGTVCGIDVSLFGDAASTRKTLSHRDEIVSIVQQITQNFKVPRLGRGI